VPGIERTDFHFANQVGEREEGKVGDSYTIAHPDGDLLVVVRTNRLSAFDHVMPQTIPNKGQVLNQMSAASLKDTEDIAKNWFLTSPDPNVTIGRKATPILAEMIVRGAVLGSLWKDYDEGRRKISGVTLPDGLSEFQIFDTPIVTPTTKAPKGEHDVPVSPADLIRRRRRVTVEQYDEMAATSLALFARGQERAAERGLYLGDTKFEFGTLPDGRIILIDEVLTPDSSRYFPWDQYVAYLERGGTGARPEQQSKEFVREWLKREHGFTGAPDQVAPDLPLELIAEVSSRYIQLYETMLQKTFRPFSYGEGEARLQYMEVVTGDSLHSIDDLLKYKEK
jgi:phosphoribosylaminoimidazole-succinocarboxamide synthase